ncbi:hypothetical protein [Pseudomonas sp. NFR16]|uniref:hypothetical protein n=1 Tax=Pseudomonas sp. NFR16 TaxID=1566248 RepID=UPI0015A702B4|nr:hypothetical protein [Pseudomonas sp. NFR16]
MSTPSPVAIDPNIGVRVKVPSASNELFPSPGLNAFQMHANPIKLKGQHQAL